MEMNKNEVPKEHHTMIRNRETLEITGIKKIRELKHDYVYLDTIVGDMVIKGENLEIINLDINSGSLSLNGLVHGISYGETTIDVSIEKKESFLKKILK